MYICLDLNEMEEPKEDYCLKWSEFQTNLTNTFDQLRKTEDFVDVTLSVGGKSLKCHKVSWQLVHNSPLTIVVKVWIYL